MAESPSTPDKESISPVHSGSLRKLRVSTIAVCSVIRFRNNVARAVVNTDELIQSIEQSPTFPRSVQSFKSMKYEAIDRFKQTEDFFACIRRGTREDMLRIENIIQENYLSFLRSDSDPSSFVNKPNAVGCRPIHEAIRNGNLELVKILVFYGADPSLLSKVSDTESESALVTCCRWNYINIVKFLLSLKKWKRNEIVLAKKATRNTFVLQLLKSHDRRAFSWWKCGA